MDRLIAHALRAFACLELLIHPHGMPEEAGVGRMVMDPQGQRP